MCFILILYLHFSLNKIEIGSDIVNNLAIAFELFLFFIFIPLAHSCHSLSQHFLPLRLPVKQIIKYNTESVGCEDIVRHTAAH